MKNNSKKRVICIIAAGICLMIISLSFFGCGDVSTGRTLEDVVPTEFGATEGLYLYKGNSRSLTDGTECETLFDAVEIDGIAYASDEYSINNYVYALSGYNIFFSLSLNEEKTKHIYIYDYYVNRGKILYSADPDCRGIWLTRSGYYVYAEIYADANTGLLFAHDGTLMCDSIAGGLLDDDILRKTEDNLSFTWYKDDVIRTVASESGLGYYKRYGDFAYFFNIDGMLAVDLNTGEYTNLLPLHDFGSYYFYYEMFYADGELYVTSVNVNGFYLHRIIGSSAETVHEFKHTRGRIRMSEVDGKMYFNDTEGGGCGGTAYYCYDVENRKMNRVSGLPKASGVSVISTKSQILEIGNYTFYVDYTSYDMPDSFTDGALFGERGYCYYLYRDDGNKTEVMQYSLETREFYDNICEF